MTSLILILLLPLVSFAENHDNLPLSRYSKHEIFPVLLNKTELELMSQKRVRVIKGIQFEREISIEDAKAHGDIVCQFENFPGHLQSRQYSRTYSRYWAEGEANYISFSTGSGYFSIVCHKQDQEVTLAELNQAFNGLLEFNSYKKSDF
jgi:hypothetical protein